MECIDEAIKLTNSYTNEIFTDMSDNDIIDNIISENGISGGIDDFSLGSFSSSSFEHEIFPKHNSNDWNFYPGQLSFGAWSDLGEASNCQVAEFLIFQGQMADQDRYLVEGYLGQKWGVDLPSNHPWVNSKPTFGDAVISGSTSVGVTTQGQNPIARNREPANLTDNSAVLTGQLVDAGLGMIPSDPQNATFSPIDYPGLRLWLDVSDADGDGTQGSSYDQTPSARVNLLKDKSGHGNDARQDTNSSRPLFVKNVLGKNSNLPVLRFDGTDDFLAFMLQ